MGATKDIKQLFFSSDLTNRTCKQCDKFFNLEDWKNDNWELEYRTNSNIDFSLFNIGTSKGKISLVIELYHEDCPKEKPRKIRQDHAIGEEYPNYPTEENKK